MTHTKQISRRKAIVGATGLALLAATKDALAQTTGPVRIGLVYSKQGPGSAIGEYLQRGSALAVAQAGGKVLDRPVELVWLDEANPQVSQQNMEKLIKEDKVVAVVGGNYSSSALAMMSVADREKIPLILTGAAASEITGKNCNRYTFRTQATVPNALMVLDSVSDVHFTTSK